MLNPPNPSVLCEQCGAPMRDGFDRSGCLHCLIAGGLEHTDRAEITARAGLPPSTAGTEGPAGGGAGAPVADASFYEHYEILKRPDGRPWELGRGAMGVTYKAIDVNLRVPVALKVIAGRLGAQSEARARFLREARSAARLRHPNVASVFHFGTVRLGAEPADAAAAGECFYSMEFVDGETLEARLRRAGPFAPAPALEIALQVAYALAAAERRGLVHRDLKPANVMLTAEGMALLDRGSTPRATGEAWVKVIDFGLAKAVSGGETDLSGAGVFASEGPVTHAGFLGTPQFTSPEQLAREQVDVRSDIYSLGVTLWYLLTGDLPFDGASPAEIHDLRRHRPLPVAQLEDAGVPAPLAALLRDMLAPDPARRPASAAALSEALEECRAALRDVPRPAMPPAARGGERPAWKWAAVGAGCVALAGAGFLSLRPYLHGPQPAGPAPAAVAIEKSVAVLPLENLSDDKENAFFADGIQDDIVASLARIKDLRVIGRSSVQQFRTGAARDLPSIGQALGVRYVLVGSVRREGDRVLVNVQLVDTRDGHPFWAERYDRTVVNSITLQGELATEIAGALSARLSPEERTRVSTRLTDNADAYLLYLRAREYQTRPSLLLQDSEMAVKLYEQAIALDGRFALAHAHLGETLAYLFLDVRPDLDNKLRARAEVEESLRLQPDLGEGHLARALCLYWTEKDYAGALQELDVAARYLPNRTEIEYDRGRILRRQGSWREAMTMLRHAVAADRHNVETVHDLALTATDLRDWETARQAWDQTVALTPDIGFLQCWRAYLDLWRGGDLRALRHAAATLPPNVDPDGAISYMRWDSAVLARDWPAAERAIALCALDPIPPPCMGPMLPKTFLAGELAMARGDVARARELFEASRPALEAEVLAHPQNASRHSVLGLLDAYLGRKEDAIREGRRGVELMPEGVNAYDGAVLSSYLALIYARCGESDLAFPLVERLLRTPGPVSWYDASITQFDLRLRWQWDPIRDDPRFAKLIAPPEPATEY